MHDQRCLQGPLNIERSPIERLIQKILLVDDTLNFIDCTTAYQQLRGPQLRLSRRRARLIHPAHPVPF